MKHYVQTFHQYPVYIEICDTSNNEVFSNGDVVKLAKNFAKYNEVFEVFGSKHYQVINTAKVKWPLNCQQFITLKNVQGQFYNTLFTRA